MATTRIISMHVNKGKSIAQTITDRTDYAQNPDKTSNGELVTGYGCDPCTADAEFYLAKQEYRHITGRSGVSFGKDVLAYHIRQSFRPGEVTPQEANRIGYELAMRFTKGNHAFIVATHIDRAHVHNHVIFNSTTLDCEKKFDDFLGSARAIRRISDILCVENGLSIVEHPKQSKGRNYGKWLGDRREPTFQEKLREMIDIAIPNSKTFEEFLSALKAAGYEIKEGKHIAFRAQGQKKYTRLRSLGDDYSEAEIRARIDGRQHSSTFIPRFDEKPAEPVSLLIDIQNNLKAKKSPGYEHWAKLFNLKQMAKTLIMLQENNVTEYPLLEQKTAQASAHHVELSGQIRAIEKRLDEIAALQKQIGNYSKTREVYAAYRKAGYNEKFFAEHESDILLHRSAKRAFDALELKKIPSIDALRQEYAILMAEKKKLYPSYMKAKKDVRDYLNAKANVDRLLAYRDVEKERGYANPEH